MPCKIFMNIFAKSFFRGIPFSIVWIFLFVVCIKDIPNPFDQKNTLVTMFLESSVPQSGDSILTDTVGNRIKIGIVCRLKEYVKFIKLKATSLDAHDTAVYKDMVLLTFDSLREYDTLWDSVAFSKPGKKVFQMEAMTTFGSSFSQRDTCLIFDRMHPLNSPPQWIKDTITVKDSVFDSISINLKEACSDSNGDSLSFVLLPGNPNSDTIISTTYKFKPLAPDTGTFSARICAIDPNNASDTVVVVMIIRGHAVKNDTVPPVIKLRKPDKDTISLNATSYKVEMECFDSSGIAYVTCVKGTDSFTVAGSDGVYSSIVSGLLPNSYNAVTFIAFDRADKPNFSSKTVYIKNDPGLEDLTPPTIQRISPEKDSGIVASDSIEVKVLCIDAGGVASVICRVGSALPIVVKKDFLYSSVIHGLSPDQLTRIVFIAVDSSKKANTDSLVVFVKYVSPKTDTIKPRLRLIQPGRDSASVATASVAVKIVASDESNIAKVECKFGTLACSVSVADSLYSAKITELYANQFNRIVFIAVDASPKANRDSLVVFINYDTTLIDSKKPTLRLIDPAHDSAVVATSATTVKIIAKDESHIARVQCFFGGTACSVSVMDSV
jgi:hypothetical protein